MIWDNPFSSKTFTSCWSNHFLNHQTIHSFDFIKGVRFYQSNFPGLKINVGKNLTKGLYYEIESIQTQDFKRNTFLVYDVIDYSGKIASLKEKGLGLHTIKQYPGYLIDLKPFNSLEDYMSNTFKKSSRYKLRKYKKRLEGCFDISFKSFGKDISKEEYDFVFELFRILLEKRFAEKKIRNNNLDHKEWDFYKDVALPLIREERATLFVLYDRGEPISVTLGYLADERVFDAITVFDIDYAKFHLGSIKIMYLINWAISNNWNVLDFSKGHFDYKTRWSNKKYYFHYHILFDKKSLYSRLLASFIKYFFELKQYLRNKNFNEVFHRFTYKITNKKPSNVRYSFIDYNDFTEKHELNAVNIDEPSLSFLKNICYDFLYLHQINVKDLKVFQVSNANNLYLLKGQKTKTFVQFT